MSSQTDLTIQINCLETMCAYLTVTSSADMLECYLPLVQDHVIEKP